MILTTAVAVVVVAGGFWMLGGPEGKSTVDFSTETVTKGNVSNFHYCYRNHRAGDRGGSGYAGIWYY